MRHKSPVEIKWVAKAAIVGATSLCALTAASAQAQNTTVAIPPPAPPAPVRPAERDQVLSSLRLGSAREQYISQVVSPLRSADRDGDGLDQADLDRIAARSKASDRARQIERVLRYDYDGDLKVTRAEVESFEGSKNSDRMSRTFDRLFKDNDHNGDGVISVAEAAKERPSRPRYRDDRNKALLELDPNGDGVLTANELLTLARTTFDRFDTNGNDVIDSDEMEAVSSAKRFASEKARLRRNGCEFPSASRSAELVFFGTNRPARKANVYVGSPTFGTGVIDVEIEKGTTPLYLLLGTSDAAIWRFTGATDRVERVAVSARNSVNRIGRGTYNTPTKTSAAGVVGLPASKVTVVPPNCLRSYYSKNERGRRAPNAIANVISGRDASKIGSEYNVSTLALPSITLSQPSDPEMVARPASRRYRATDWRVIAKEGSDLVELDAKSVVASEAVGSYDVLPGHYGIAQLVADGALVPDEKDRLLIVKPIAQWPAGLTGTKVVTFIQKDGVTLPEGRPGFSCVLTQEQAAGKDWESQCRNNVAPPPPIEIAPDY